MDSILIEVEKLKNMVILSDEYKNFINSRNKLDANEDINKIIDRIKNTQKALINKEDKNEDITEEEIILKSLYTELDSFECYKEYIKNAKILNELITKIQKRFEDYFNKLVI